jgi:UDP-3-O-[3-hydroxymyristoyl] glucosamine N-acyltransferase
VGAHSLIVAQVGISGSTVVGSGVTLGGQVGVNGHIRIGDGVVLAAKSGVWGSITEPGVYSGNPARPHKENLRTQAQIGRIARLRERLRALEKAVFGRDQADE